MNYPSDRIWFQGSWVLRSLLAGAAIALWFWSQTLIGSRPAPASGVGDWIHMATAGWNLYLQNHPPVTNGLLILSSAIIDLLSLLLLGQWIFSGELRPFLGLVMVLGARQIMQACVAPPIPPGAIWHHPGFPSLMVTYGVANDYFFSGHTAIAVLGAVELARLGKRWLRIAAPLIVVFEMVTVLALRAHYTMDVFTGLIAGLYAAHLADRVEAWSRQREYSAER